MRLAKIEIKDFRAFPGPGTYAFDLGGKNLLVYGENSSGKSSLFRALVEFFNLDSRAKPFAEYKHIFSDPGMTNGHITVHFDDGQAPACWQFGDSRPTGEARVAETALRKGCLDYRALMRTNFLHGTGSVNLFDLVIEELLANYPLISVGPTATIGKLWQEVLDSLPKTHRRRHLERINDVVTRFNQAVDPVWPELQTKAEAILKAFPGCGVALQFDFPGVAYDIQERRLTQKHLYLAVDLNGKRIPEHQHFLNEARLSAIALSLYFAGLLISIPSTVPGAPAYPKILALDDVLIGLDMSNRMPVLDILREHFPDWQIILLTYDKIWYEIVRMQTEASRDWLYHELYLGTAPEGFDVPVHRGHGEGWPHLLARARQHLAAHDERAAAVYARAAFESKLQRYCEDKRVPVRYHSDPRRLEAEWFWQAVNVYPDVVVVCGTPQFEDSDLDTLLNPTLVIEVLSQSTEFRDRGVKAQGYRLIDSLTEYLLIAQDRCRIEQYTRQADNQWLLVDFYTLEETVNLVSTRCTLLLQDVYDRVLPS